jgi:hypothetical protein
MKAAKKKKPIRRSFLTFSALLVMSLLLSTQANAGFNFWKNNTGYTYTRSVPVVVAACQTITPASTLPTYVCCKLAYKKHHQIHYVWRDTWVSGSCKYANRHARFDSGCDLSSPVYGTGAPIMGSCQITSR